MGRLDDAAKHKVVELRKAGLSFRKIKAVLELENIKVSAQAIYLFLREFQGRPPGRVRPAEARSSRTAKQVQAQAGAIQESWSNVHLQNLLGEASHHNGLTTASEFAKQASSNPEASAKPPEYGRGSRSQQHKGDNGNENEIQIVSVTSLAQNSQQRGLQATVTRAESGAVTSTPHAAGPSTRRRCTPSPATTAMLATRKRLLDKALSHRMKQSNQQVASVPRKDPTSVQGSNLKSAVSQPPQTYNLTTEKGAQTVSEGQPGGSPTKRFLTQRSGLSVRSPHPPPRVGIRLPNQPPAPLTSSAPGGAIIRLQNAGGLCTTRTEGSAQQAAHIPGGRGGLQDQIQTLSTEVRSLGLAVKMLVEQQCRLEREQVQQTHVQKQILSTLQSLALKLGHCSSSQEQHNKTPSPSTLSTASTSTSFSQEGFNFNQGTYTQCSQTQPSYNSLDSIESVETFKLAGLSPTGINGFPTCSNADSIPLTHTPPQRQPYAAAYTEQASQTLMPPYTQSYVSSYSQSHSQNFRLSEGKSSDFTSSCSVRTLQDCSVSIQPGMNSNHTAQDEDISIIKVEGP